MSGHAPGNGVNAELHVHAAFGQCVVEFAHLVLRLGDGHAVAGNDHHFVRRGQNRRRLFGGCALHRPRLARARARDLLLSKRAKQNIRERAVHGLRHVHREDETRSAIQCAGYDQELAVQNKAHRRCGKPGVGIQQGNDRGHIGAADGNDHQHAEKKRDADDPGKELLFAGMQDQVHRYSHGDGQQGKIDEVLPSIRERALRQDFLKFSRGHQTAGKRQRPQDDFHGQDRHHEPRNVGRAQVELRSAHKGDAKRPEGVAQRGPLRHCGHVHHPQRDAEDRAEHKRDGDPPVVHDSVMQQRSGDGQDHAHLAGTDAAPRGAWRAHPFQRKDEQRGGNQVGDLDDVFGGRHRGHGFGGRLALNIPSMRSVITKPPTTLLVAATIAMVPSTVEKVLLCSPTRMMAPTTAMASSAFVSDIRGVCSSGETRRMTSKPMNAASMNT